MVFYREKFEVQSEGLHPTIHNITCLLYTSRCV